MMPRQLMASLWDLQSKKRIRFKTDEKILPVHIHKDVADVESPVFLLALRDFLFKKLIQMERIRALKLDEV